MNTTNEYNNKNKKNRSTDTGNKLVVTTEERKVGRGTIGVGN